MMFNTVEIEINHQCNMSCSYCPNGQLQRIEKGDMSEELFSLIINQLVDIEFAGTLSFHFYNEPMLSTKLLDFTALARKNLPRVSIELYTNGTLLTLERFFDLVDAGISKFIVTKHEKVRQYAFEETLSKLSPPQKSLVEYKEFNDIKLTNRGGLLPHLGQERMPLVPCYVPSNMLTISVKGNVIPCFEDFFQQHQMGNVQDRHLKDIWLDPKYADFRLKLKMGMRHMFEVCKSCNRSEVLF